MSTNEPMAPLPPQQTSQPAVSSTQLALIVYILYFVSYVVGITSVIGVVIAHVQVGEAEPMLRSHYQFQIRTFWIGIVYLAVGIVLSLVIIGIPILVWWFVWSLVRNVKGVLALNDNRPIRNPASWMFG